jgi:hypothetical protein
MYFATINENISVGDRYNNSGTIVADVLEALGYFFSITGFE